MHQILITFTKLHRLAKPGKLPDITRGHAESWFSGWWHGIGIGAVLGMGLMLLATEARAEKPEVIGVHLGTWHSKPAPKRVGEWSDFNPGIYARWSNGFTAGTLRNSERRQSVYAGWTWEGPRHWTVRPALTVGAITGYTSDVSPLAALSAAAQITRRTAARLAWLPKAEDGGAHGIHLSLEWSTK